MSSLSILSARSGGAKIEMPMSADEIANISADDRHLEERLKEIVEVIETVGSADEWLRLVSNKNHSYLHAMSALCCRSSDASSAVHCYETQIVFMWLSLQPHISASLISKTYPKIVPALASFINKQPGSGGARDRKQYEMTQRAVLLLLHAILFHINPSTLDLSEQEVQSTIVNVMTNLASDIEQVFDLASRVVILLNKIHPKMNILVKCADNHPSLRPLSERVVVLFNKPFDTDDEDATEFVLHANHRFLRSVVHLIEAVFTSTSQEFFYTNDVTVIIDVLIRRINDSNKGEIGFVFELLRCFQRVLQWEKYGERRYKLDEIESTLRSVLDTLEERKTGGTLPVQEAHLYYPLKHLLTQILTPLAKLSAEAAEAAASSTSPTYVNRPAAPTPTNITITSMAVAALPSASSSPHKPRQQQQQQQAVPRLPLEKKMVPKPAAAAPVQPSPRPPPRSSRPSVASRVEAAIADAATAVTLAPASIAEEPQQQQEQQQQSAYQRGVALHDYLGGNLDGQTELVFHGGDDLMIHVQDNGSGWWYGYHTNDVQRAGWLPSGYVKLL